MNLQKYLVLHRSEWERIKNHCQSHNESFYNEEHLKLMHELSQKWIKSWPDTVEGCVELFKKKESLTRKKDFAEIKRFALRKKQDDSAVVMEKARQQLFNDSCHGRQLISCLIESKILEERDAQVEFKDKLKVTAVLNENESITRQNEQIKQAEINEENKLKEKKKINKKIAEINKETYEKLKKIRTCDLEKQKSQELECLHVLKKLLDDEKKYEIEDKFNRNKCLYQENIKYSEIKNQMRERRKRETEQIEKIDEVWRKYNETVRCKVKLMQEKKETDENYKKQMIYHKLEKIKKEQNDKYNEFIEKGVKCLEENSNNFLDKENELAKKKPARGQELSNSNLTNTNDEDFSVSRDIKQENNKKTENCTKFCVCNRQTLICKSSGKEKNYYISQKDDQSLKFLSSPKTLEEDLRRREKEPSPWSGTKLAHQQFAKQASKTLDECRYKKMALKVIENYRRNHLLTAYGSPTTNYQVT